LTFAPGVKVRQPAQTTVTAYAPLLIVEPRKDNPDQLHAFLLEKPLAVSPFFKSILPDAAYSDWLGKAVKATPSLASSPTPTVAAPSTSPTRNAGRR